MGAGCRSAVLRRRGSAAQTGRRTTRRSAQSLWPLLAPVGLGLVIAGGESWADPAIVSPNGLTVQVNPTFPEPGLPAFSFPQGGLSDTGGVAGAVTIGGGSGSGSGSGADSHGFGGRGRDHCDGLRRPSGSERRHWTMRRARAGLVGRRLHFDVVSRRAGRGRDRHRGRHGDRDVRQRRHVHEHLWAVAYGDLSRPGQLRHFC
jgi:hypothetical protein